MTFSPIHILHFLFWSQNDVDLSSGWEYDSAKKTFVVIKKIILGLLYKLNIFEWQVSFLFPNKNILSSHMAQISENINYSNKKVHSYDQTRKIIINIVSKKFETMTPPLSKSPVYRIHYKWVWLTPLKIIYPMLIKKMTWEKYVHLQ